MQTPVIEIKDYSFSIGGADILKNISLDVFEGEYLSIIGPNGAGKSTLLKCLIRIYTGGKGVIRLYGKLLSEYGQKELARLISYVPQSDGRNLDFTVYEFVLMGRYPYLSPFSSVKSSDKSAVDDALKLTETARLSDRSINTLSGGEKQNVMIAAAIAQGAKILLLDEPTTFLDPKHQSDINRTLKRVNRASGITIISVTHDINSAAMISDRMTVLKNGRSEFSGVPSELMDNTVLEKVYNNVFRFCISSSDRKQDLSFRRKTRNDQEKNFIIMLSVFSLFVILWRSL